MSDSVISYPELCSREGTTHQQTMIFGLGRNHSVIFLSLLANENYRDRLKYSKTTLVCEGHDAMKRGSCLNPWMVDQPLNHPSGVPTQNGKFHAAAQAARFGQRLPERVRIYERLSSRIWSYSGVFHLVDSWTERDKFRSVYKFKLIAVEGDDNLEERVQLNARRRCLIPRDVKLEVWQRDGGKCSICGATDDLHFAHSRPFAKYGTAAKADCVQLRCARQDHVRTPSSTPS